MVVKRKTNYPRSMYMQGMKMGIRKGSFFGRFKRRAKKTMGYKPSFMSHKTKRIKTACDKQIKRNIQTYKKKLMTDNGFFNYRALLILGFESINTGTIINGMGQMLYTKYQLINKGTNPISTAANYPGQINDVDFFIFQPQWPGEKCGFFLNRVQGGTTQPIFGAVGSTANSVNDNFKATYSPCANAKVMGSSNECSKNFGDGKTFNKIYVYNTTITYNLTNLNTESVRVHILDVKFRTKNIGEAGTLKLVNGATLFEDLVDNEGATKQLRYYLSTQLKKNMLPRKICQVIRKKVVTLGPAYVSGSDTTGPTGYRNTINSKMVTMKYNGLKTINRGVISSQANNEGLNDDVLGENWQNDVYTIMYVTPVQCVTENSGVDTVKTLKINTEIRKAITYGTSGIV